MPGTHSKPLTNTPRIDSIFKRVDKEEHMINTEVDQARLFESNWCFQCDFLGVLVSSSCWEAYLCLFDERGQ